MPEKGLLDDGMRKFHEQRIDGQKRLIDAQLDLLQTLIKHGEFDQASTTARDLSAQLTALNNQVNFYVDHTDGTAMPKSLINPE